MAWFKNWQDTLKLSSEKKKEIPDGVWLKCRCSEILYRKELVKNNMVCHHCSYHFPLTGDQWLEILFDEGTFKEWDKHLRAADPLKFIDSEKYKDRLKRAEEKSGRRDSVLTGSGQISKHQVVIAIFDFNFMGGSLGSVSGEKILRAIELAIEKRLPLMIISASGGARMQEGIFSLMQMAKTSAAIAKLAEHQLPYVSILSNPTTGGVTASFSSLGDINIAEPKTLIVFTGPRVIERTIKEKVPEGAQSAENLLKNGFVDMIIDRREMKNTLTRILDFFQN